MFLDKTWEDYPHLDKSGWGDLCIPGSEANV